MLGKHTNINHRRNATRRYGFSFTRHNSPQFLHRNVDSNIQAKSIEFNDKLLTPQRRHNFFMSKPFPSMTADCPCWKNPCATCCDGAACQTYRIALDIVGPIPCLQCLNRHIALRTFLWQFPSPNKDRYSQCLLRAIEQRIPTITTFQAHQTDT